MTKLLRGPSRQTTSVRAFLGLCLLLLVAPGILAQNTTATAQSAKPAAPAPVVVVNDPVQPVPVQTQGTTNVAGSVSIANTPNVNVANTPSVNIANTPTVTLSGNSQVTLTSSPGSAPLLVSDVNLPAKHVFQHAGPANDSFTVPAGKLLVIEWVSFATPNTINVGGIQVMYVIGNVAGGQSGFFSYKSDIPTAGTSGLSFVANQPARIYCDPGSTVSIAAVVPFFNNNAVGSYTVSGYLVDVP
jgi:hypothetical protein